jgi:nitroreductase
LRRKAELCAEKYSIIMNIESLIKQNRSYRRFDGRHPVEKNVLTALVELTRFVPSARNAQSLRYFITNEPTMNEQIFTTLSWAGYLKDWKGPSETERPTAYIVVATSIELKNAHTTFDAGVAVQSILLSAVEQGLGGCIIVALKKETLAEIIGLDKSLEIVCVIALGKPVEKVVIDTMEDGNYHYWRDENQVHHVPKRSLKEILLNP